MDSERLHQSFSYFPWNSRTSFRNSKLVHYANIIWDLKQIWSQTFPNILNLQTSVQYEFTPKSIIICKLAFGSQKEKEEVEKIDDLDFLITT
jgi:hypothetical protein